MSGRAVLVVTRFAIDFKGHPTAEWVAERGRLAAVTCGPSIAACAERTPLTWVWRTSDTHREQTEAIADTMPYRPVVVGTESTHPDIAPDHRRLLTFRLDSDDAYTPDAVAWAAALNVGPGTIVDFPDGWQHDLATGRVGARRHPTGPFLAVAHNARGRMLGVGGNHGTVRTGKTVVSCPFGAWVQTVHGGNVSNGWRRDTVPLLGADAAAVLASVR